MLVKDFLKKTNKETREEYIIRVTSVRNLLKMGWSGITSIINAELKENNSPDAIRCYMYRRNGATRPASVQNENIEKTMEDNANKDIRELDEIRQKFELSKMKVKLSDERTQINAYVRSMAREETLKEIANDVAEKMSAKKELKPFSKKSTYVGRKKEGILEISDVHYGAVISNYWNQYNPEVARNYFSQLRDEVVKKCQLNDVKVLHVVNLGDLINGLIHLRIRLESRIDVVTQTIEISEILAEFLHSLSEFFEVHFYSCLDNHSRLDPNKKDSMDLESMARIIPWYLQSRIADSIIFHENKYDPEIITFQSNGFNILGVHGDKDKLGTIVEKMSVMTHDHYDLILTAHLHHFSCDEQNETLVVSNGSMLGTDTFAKNLRLTSKPSQNLIIVGNKNVAECIYRIILS